MQIYLTPPGGEREGPYTLEQINRDLAARKYKDTDYWAWYSGQTEWVPLHKVPGVVGGDDTLAWVLDEPTKGAPLADAPVQTRPPETSSGPTSSQSAPAQSGATTPPAPDPGPPVAESSAPAATPPSRPEPTPAEQERKLFSGLAFAALEQVFILTSGDGPAASRSPVTQRVLEQTVGESIATIRERTQRDVLSHCGFIEQLRTQTALPAAAWSAMANFRMQLVQDARAGRYKLCVRNFPIENGELVCLFLFYNRGRL
jgi:hypothetical protein